MLANTVLQIYITDLPIRVNIQVVEDLLKLLLVNVKTPLVKEVSELIRGDEAIFAFVQIRESLLDGLPLHLELVHDRAHQISVNYLLLSHLNGLLSALNLLLQILLVLRVLHRIVSEVESLTRLNSGSHPFAEVFEIQLSLFACVSVLEKSFKILEVHVAT